MGLADYGVLLKPGREAVSVSAIVRALQQEGFAGEKMTQDYSGARLAAPPADRVAFILHEHRPDRTEFILEALLRWNPGENEKPDLYNLSLRFAICQSADAAEAFFKEVERLSRMFHLIVLANEKEYSPKMLPDYRKMAEAEIQQQKIRWHEMFGLNSEEIALPVEAAWSHFMQAHPDLLKQRAG